ncbi:MAG: phosphate acyltransferase PlsX [Dehalococcoidia bacterium]|nr:phosphate acyltransferase PlsX [Dehalococcoidia bacterium]
MEKRRLISENDKPIRIAVDAMGGDFAPAEIVKGAVLAAEHKGIEIILVGIKKEIVKYLPQKDTSHLPIRYVEASQLITNEENPAFAIYRKPDASIVVASKLVKSGEADAVISAGSTGAMATSAIQFIGKIEGISRPAIGSPIDVLAPNTILIDCGANVDCKPHQLLSFGIAGSVYSKKLLNIGNPKVALLNIGSELGKGNQAIKASYPLFEKSNLNFIGFVEGNDILCGRADVVVCDGFVGNILMKFYESIGPRAEEYLKVKIKGKIPMIGPVKKLFKDVFSLTQMSQTTSIGGGLLWGVNGIAMVMHGNIKAEQAARTIVRARDTVNADVVNYLKEEMTKINDN